MQVGEIIPKVANWVLNTKAKPGVAFGNVKTHKPGNPLRLITSCCGTAIENLSAFKEFYLQPLARKLPSYITDSTDLLNKIEQLNQNGPFPPGTLLVSWDVVSMFPNIYNNLGIKAVEEALNSRNGTAMGPKNACSYADVAMGIIDQKAKYGGKIKPLLWWRYRDDIFDLWKQGLSALNAFTDYTNTLYPNIKFELVYSDSHLNVLDLTLHLVDGYIQMFIPSLQIVICTSNLQVLIRNMFLKLYHME